ncbi:MAG: LarC family nickel insertion protein [Pseudomonadota bacterium]
MDSEAHIQIKALGGIAGDMFVGACASLWPDLRDVCLGDVRAAGLPEEVETRFEEVRVNGFASIRFHVGQGPGVVPTGAYPAICARLEQSALDRAVLGVALGILKVLGEAEARVHGKTLAEVHFHELADWDSVADIVGAASFIARSGTRKWSTGPLPLGGGTVETQHGTITVPAPAVLEMLGGYAWHDDGHVGERVTPTGAAILRYLTDPADGPATGALAGQGFGAGTKRFKGLANVVQLVAFQGAVQGDEVIAELSFDVDDMTPEELATAAERLRAEDGVLDVTQTAQIGKKGRAMILIRVLTRQDAVDGIADEVFRQTSTLGVRMAELRRRTLPRVHVASETAVKIAHRPGAATAKAEADDLARQPTLAARRAEAQAAERAALEGADD